MSTSNIEQQKINQKQKNRSILLQRQLREEILPVIKKNDIQGKAVQKLFRKSLFLSVLWLACYFGFLSIVTMNNLIGIILSSLLLGFVNVIICFTIFHDASHGTFKSLPGVSELLAFVITSLFGASSMIWYEKHVKTHHVYTNVFGQDTDIATRGIFRLHRYDKWHQGHRLQHYYALPLYSLLMLKWIYYDDIKSIITNEYGFKGKKYLLSICDVVLTRAVHLLVFLIIPSFYFKSLYCLLFSYILINLTMGIVLSIIFQLAHINPKALFQTTSDAKNSNRFLDQLSSTADFATNNKYLTWMTGGLNMQVIHHLFPHVAHIHYPVIQPIVKLFCQKHGLIYNEYPTLYSALKAHIAHLKQLSTPKPVII